MAEPPFGPKYLKKNGKVRTGCGLSLTVQAESSSKKKWHPPESSFFFGFFLGGVSSWLIVCLGRLVVWLPGIPENERDWQPWVYPHWNPKPPGPKPTIKHYIVDWGGGRVGTRPTYGVLWRVEFLSTRNWSPSWHRQFSWDFFLLGKISEKEFN